MKTWHVTALLAWPVGLGLMTLLIGFWGYSVVLAQAPWPTPPPAPVGTFPQVIPASEVTPVPAPRSPGSIALQVDPIFAGPIPRIPPRPYITILSGEPDAHDRIILDVYAGTIDRTLQLTYEPLAIDQVPKAITGHRIQRAFRLQTYDHTAAAIVPVFRHPVRLILHAREQELSAAGNDPARLLVARFDAQRNVWLPLITTFQPADATLMVRILQPGLFALITQQPPVPG